VQFWNVADVSDAVDILAERGTGAIVLAGGTDVMLQHRRNDFQADGFLYIGSIKALHDVSLERSTSLGALCTHETLWTHSELSKRHPALAEAARTVGGWQTQSVGTIGGNICNASPAADTAPALLISAADVTIQSAQASREVPIDEFFVGRRETVVAPTELVTRLHLPKPPDRCGETYIKVGRRSSMEVAIVGVAVRIWLDVGGTVAGCRIALCSVGPRPFRAVEAEAALVGTEAAEDDADHAASLACSAASPIDDARATATYRKRVIRSTVTRAILSSRNRAEMAGTPS